MKRCFIMRIQKLVILSVLTFCLLQSMFIVLGKSNSKMLFADTTSKSLDEIVELDTPIRKAVQSLLGRKSNSTEDITVQDMNSITGRLYTNEVAISSLEGLEHAISLDEIIFIGAGLENASVFSNLSQLRVLGLSMNQITEIPSMQAMAKLEWFNVTDNEICDISGITEAVNLQYLEAYNNLIKVLPNLEGMNELSYLDLSGNKINSIEHMSGLPKLTRINLMGNQVDDIYPLADIEGLDELLVQYNNIKSLEGEGVFLKLKKLYAGNNDISSYDLKKNFPVLEVITLNNCGIDSLDGFLDHPTLKVLGLSDNNITDLSALAELTSDTLFTEVSLSNNQISDISSLKDFDFPFVIRLDGNPIDWEDEDNIAIIERMLDKYPYERYKYYPSITETPAPSPSPLPTMTLATSINSEVISSQAEPDPLIDWTSRGTIIILVVIGSIGVLVGLYVLRKNLKKQS